MRKSKTLATWLALVGGAIGAHRFYLRGLRDPLAWLHPALALPGYVGVLRMQQLGQDDQLAWALIPLLGLSLSIALLSGIVYGLTPDERWDARHNPGVARSKPSGWAAVIGVVVCLLVGGTALMATIAFSAQRYFESQASSSE